MWGREEQDHVPQVLIPYLLLIPATQKEKKNWLTAKNVYASYELEKRQTVPKCQSGEELTSF